MSTSYILPSTIVSDQESTKTTNVSHIVLVHCRLQASLPWFNVAK